MMGRRRRDQGHAVRYFASVQRVQGLAGTKAETRVMPGTSHRVADHQSVRQRRAVVGAGGVDRKDLSAGGCQSNCLFADVTRAHVSDRSRIAAYPIDAAAAAKFPTPKGTSIQHGEPSPRVCIQ